MKRNLTLRKLISYILVTAMLIAMTGVVAPLTASAVGNSYYIDSIGGSDNANGLTPATAWQTLNKVNGHTFVPGDRIYFKRGGSWNGVLKPPGSGTSASPIIIDAYSSGAKPIINGNGVETTLTDSTGTYTASFTVLLDNQEYWEIKNLDITNSGGTNPSGDRWGIFSHAHNIGTLHHIYISYCDIHDIAISASASHYGAGIGMVVWSGSSDLATHYDDLLVEYCNLTNLTGSDGAYYGNKGIDISSNEESRPNDPYTQGYPAFNPHTNVKIRNNSLTNIALDGILASVCRAPVVEYNVSNNANASGGYGIAMWPHVSENSIFQFNEAYNTGDAAATYDGDGDAFNISRNKNTIYQYNYSHNNLGGFMLIDNYSNPSVYNNNIVRYNVSQNDQYELFQVISSGLTKVYNNTFYIGSGLTHPPYIVVANQNGTDPWPFDQYFYNNIFYDNGSNGWSWGSTTKVFDKNIFYPTYNLSGEPAGQIHSNPNLVNPGSGGTGIDFTDVNRLSGYKLQSSSTACIDTGKDILSLWNDNTAITWGLPNANGGKDFWGTALYQNNLADIGAYEYGETIVDFESRGTADQALTGIYPTGGIDWGTSDWRTAYYAGFTVYLYANNSSTAEIIRTFTLPAGKVLKSLKIAGQPSVTNTVKVSQPGNTEITWTNIPNNYKTYNTGWTSATGSTVTVKITCTDPTLGAAGIAFDDIAYSGSVKLTVSSASASSTYLGTWTASRAIDGSITPADSTTWSASSASQPQWLKLDLGTVKTVNKTNIAWYNPTMSTYTYNIQVSTDDVTYTTVVSSKNSTSSTWLADTFANTSARYVKINITASTYDWDAITEAEVFGN